MADKNLHINKSSISCFFLFILFFFTHSAKAQSDNKWVHQFEVSDQEILSDLYHQSNGIENSDNHTKIHLVQKINLQYQIATIYKHYLEGTIGAIKDIPNYSASLKNSYNNFINGYRVLHATDSILTINKNSLSSTGLMQKADSVANATLLNAKQFFTLISIANKESIIKKSEQLNAGNIYSINSWDMESLLLAWNNYLYSQDIPTAHAEEEVKNQVIQEQARPLLVNQPLGKASEKKLTDKPKALTSAKNITRNNNTNQAIQHGATMENLTGLLVFRVQIAASKTPLDTKKLKSIYKGKLEVKQFREEGWYKYYIADCTELSKAKQIRKKSKVDDAFIMAYADNKKIQNYKDYLQQHQLKILDGVYKNLAHLSQSNSVVVVQIAADRVPLSKQHLSEIYNGSVPLNYIYDDGWHKYSIGTYKNFWQANKQRKLCGVPSAFVVAYKKGEKVDLWLKRKKNKK